MSDAVEKAAKQLKLEMLGSMLTGMAQEHEPGCARAAFDECVADIKRSMATGETTLDEWITCLRACGYRLEESNAN